MLVSSSVRSLGLMNLVKAFRPAFVGVVVLSFFINVLVFTSPIYSLQIYDRVLSSRNVTTLAMITVIVAFLYLVYAGLEHYRSRILVQISAAFDQVVADHAFGIAMEGALNVRSAQHTRAIRDAETIRDFVSNGAVVALFDAPWSVVFIMMCFMIHHDVGLLALVASALLFGLSVANEMITRSGYREAGLASSRSVDRLSASLRNAETIRALGMTSIIRRIWRNGHDEALEHGISAGERGGTIFALIKFLRLCVQSASLGVGAWLALHNDISSGTIFATSMIIGRAMSPVEMVVAHWKSVLSVREAWLRFDQALRSKPIMSDKMEFRRPSGRVSVEKLVVVPPGGKKAVVKGVDLEIAEGEVVAVLGKTGSGKSSLARAIVGAWRAVSGAVRYDGANIAHHDSDEVGRFVGYLPQDVELFAGSVRDNIARFSSTSDDRVFDAAELANAHEMIQRLDDGYRTDIGEDGVGLSGGQRQKIALARAVFGEPAIVVLDEPNANLDGDGDAALRDTIVHLKNKGVTVVVITHKADVLAVCDRIVVMHEGVVVRQGGRDEMLSAISGRGHAPVRVVSNS